MNGLSMWIMPIVGRQVLSRGRQPKARSTRARLGIRIMGRGPFTKASSGRRINVDRVSIDGGVSFPKHNQSEAIWPLSIGRITFNADSYNRCFRYLDCFDGVFWCSSTRRQCVTAAIHESRVRYYDTRRTFKTVSISSQFDRITQTRMPEGFKFKCNQNQALTSPRQPGGWSPLGLAVPVPNGAGLMPPCRGRDMVKRKGSYT
jgi:hypothetical protein